MKVIHFVAITVIMTLTLLGCGSTSGLTAVEKQPTEGPVSNKFTLVRLEASGNQLETLLKAEVQKAKQQERRPFVEFYADWCPPCNALRKNLGDPRMIDAFAGTYIIQLNLDEWKGQLSQTDFRVSGIPIFFELNESGEPTGRVITGGAWGEDIPENMAPPLKSFFQGDKSWIANKSY